MAAVLAAILLTTGIVYAVFRSEGIHIWGDYTSIHFDTACYIYDANKGEFLADSHLIWNEVDTNRSGEGTPPTPGITVRDYPIESLLDAAKEPHLKVQGYLHATIQLEGILHDTVYCPLAGGWKDPQTGEFQPDVDSLNVFQLKCEIATGKLAVRVELYPGIYALAGFENQADALAFWQEKCGSSASID